jgi:hypothetical protein
VTPAPMDSPTCMSEIQSPLQACLRPAQLVWSPTCLGDFNHCRRRWRIQAPPREIVVAIAEILRTLSYDDKMSLRIGCARVHDHGLRLQANLWAPREWLDCLELHAESNMADATDVEIACYATGVCPTFVPLAPLFNLLVCCVPLGSSDFQSPGVSLQPKRVNRLRELLSARLGVEVEVIEDR